MSLFRCMGGSKRKISYIRGWEMYATDLSVKVLTATKKMYVIFLIIPNNNTITLTTTGTLLFQNGWGETTDGIIMRFVELNKGDSVTVAKSNSNYVYGRYYTVQ